MNLNDCILIAVSAHKDQKDKIGEPYILHPIRVMLACNDEISRMVAILHDVIEDTEINEESLRVLGTPESVLKAVVAMTKIKGMKYQDYLNQVKADEIARRVKVADIRDNMSPIRLYRLDHKTRERLERKYIDALKFLES